MPRPAARRSVHRLAGPKSTVQDPQSKTILHLPFSILAPNHSGVIYGPFTDELWTATRGGPTRLNGRVVRVSRCTDVGQAVIAMGFSKSKLNLEKSLPHVSRLSARDEIRIMGSAALELAYVACGRLDAYVEATINLWDIAAGRVAGGMCRRRILHAAAPGGKFRMVADNGRLRRKLQVGSCAEVILNNKEMKN